MTAEERAEKLRDLQALDQQLQAAEARLRGFEPALAAVEEPARSVEREIQTLRDRLKDLKVEERRLERSADEKRARARLLQERLKTVRNLREEAAAQAELDLVRKALDGYEQEALMLLEQIRKVEERLSELEGALESVWKEVEANRARLLDERRAAEEELAVLASKRENQALRIAPQDLKLYERVRAGGRSVVVATLTPDGACGQCYNMVPLQIQNEIRAGKVLISCEACGVLLAPAKGV